MSRRHNTIGIVICCWDSSEAKVISAIEKRMNFFQVVNDRVIAVPYETGLISEPVRVSFRSHAVVRMIEGPAVFLVRSKNHRNATARPALGTKAELQGGRGV